MFGMPRSATARAAVRTGVVAYTPQDFQAWAARTPPPAERAAVPGERADVPGDA
jgi:CRP-like cAMP-binding protein